MWEFRRRMDKLRRKLTSWKCICTKIYGLARISSIRKYIHVVNLSLFYKFHPRAHLNTCSDGAYDTLPNTALSKRNLLGCSPFHQVVSESFFLKFHTLAQFESSELLFNKTNPYPTLLDSKYEGRLKWPSLEASSFPLGHSF